MLHQTAEQFIRDAEKVSIGPREDVKPADRQRGMWSFLTWSFFLAQALAAHEAFAKGVGAGQEGVDNDAGVDSAADAALKQAMATALSGVPGDDAAAAAAAQLAAAMAAGVITPQMWSAIGDNPVLFKALLDALAAEQLANAAGTASADATGALPDAGGECPAGDGCDGTPIGEHLPGVTLPDLPIEVIADLGLELGGNLVDAVDDIVGAVAETVIGTVDVVISATTEVVSGAVEFIGDTAEMVVSAATGLVTGTVDAVTAAATGLVDGTLNTVAAVAAPLVGETVGTVVNTAADAVVDPLVATTSDVVASGGAIVLGAAAAVTGTMNTLFSNGSHTDYAVELHTSSDMGNDTLNAGADADVSAGTSALDVVAAVDDTTKGLVDEVGHTLNNAVNTLGSLGDGWS